LGDKVSVDYIINLHTIQQDWPVLSKIININSEIIHINKSHHEDYKTYYKKDYLIEIVEKIYQPDIKFFGFKFEDKFHSDFSRIINKRLFLNKKYA
jgi:hypothetical protein